VYDYRIKSEFGVGKCRDKRHHRNDHIDDDGSAGGVGDRCRVPHLSDREARPARLVGGVGGGRRTGHSPTISERRLVLCVGFGFYSVFVCMFAI